jgi:HD-like signal output (HDOD) protein
VGDPTASARVAAFRRDVARLKSVPTLSRHLERVVTALDDPDVDLDHVARLIETDQGLTSQILRLANSAFYSGRGAVTQVTVALVMLGAVVTRSAVLASSLLDPRQMALRGFVEHALGCAVAAGALARVTGLAEPEDAAIAGLLHDLGKVVLWKEMPEAFAYILAQAEAEQRSFRDVEREVLGVDHAEVAGWLVERWRFPATLAEPIVHHHTPARARLALDQTAIVHVANTLVRAVGYGFGGDHRLPAIDPTAWKRLHLEPALLDRVLDGFTTDLDGALNYALFE